MVATTCRLPRSTTLTVSETWLDTNSRSELGFERYLALGILGRNLHVLGRLVIAKKDEQSEAAKSLRRRQSAA